MVIYVTVYETVQRSSGFPFTLVPPAALMVSDIKVVVHLVSEICLILVWEDGRRMGRGILLAQCV